MDQAKIRQGGIVSSEKRKTESLYSGMYNSISYCYWWYDRSIANANGIL